MFRILWAQSIGFVEKSEKCIKMNGESLALREGDNGVGKRNKKALAARIVCLQCIFRLTIPSTSNLKKKIPLCGTIDNLTALTSKHKLKKNFEPKSSKVTRWRMRWICNGKLAMRAPTEKKIAFHLNYSTVFNLNMDMNNIRLDANNWMQSVFVCVDSSSCVFHVGKGIFECTSNFFVTSMVSTRCFCFGRSVKSGLNHCSVEVRQFGVYYFSMQLWLVQLQMHYCWSFLFMYDVNESMFGWEKQRSIE